VFFRVNFYPPPAGVAIFSACPVPNRPLPKFGAGWLSGEKSIRETYPPKAESAQSAVKNYFKGE
jgi:hypothetical protein